MGINYITLLWCNPTNRTWDHTIWVRYPTIQGRILLFYSYNVIPLLLFLSSPEPSTGDVMVTTTTRIIRGVDDDGADLWEHERETGVRDVIPHLRNLKLRGWGVFFCVQWVVEFFGFFFFCNAFYIINLLFRAFSWFTWMWRWWCWRKEELGTATRIQSTRLDKIKRWSSPRREARFEI